MLGSSTHDTKRSEDVRARLGVLSEQPSVWRLWLRRWSLINRSLRREESPAPSRADEYHYYQALIGIWPSSAPDEHEVNRLKERLKAYMLKAAREAKQRTSWINPDTEYEAALERFVNDSLGHTLFLRELNESIPRLARIGMLVGLSQALVKVASPGVADYYQGTELWDFSLVDPDNRRPVDFPLRKKLLAESASPGEMIDNLSDGRAKLYVIRKGLELRKAHPALFCGGSYSPLYADGGREQNVLAFALRAGGRTLVAIAPRLFARLMQPNDLAPIRSRVWGDARLPRPQMAFEDGLPGRGHAGGATLLGELLADFPVALLLSQ
jgi:(1->4)-alpha-D-glucan 1-alpha-D-glucosylmutase